MEATRDRVVETISSAAAERTPLRVRLVLSNGIALGGISLLRLAGERPASAADVARLCAGAASRPASSWFVTYMVGLEVEVVPFSWLQRVEVAGAVAWSRDGGERDGSEGSRGRGPLSESVLHASHLFADADLGLPLMDRIAASA